MKRTVFIFVTCLTACLALLSGCAEEHIHSFGDWTVVKNPTCTEAGEEERLCSCGERETRTAAATGHKYGEWKIATVPTCTEAGEEERLCTCGERQTRTAAATGHKFGDWKYTTVPTCTMAGEEERLCTCGERQTRTAAATGHKFGSWKTVKAATCTQNGEEERLCTCGERQTQTIPATGHSWKNATCTEPKTCTKCGATEGNALGHTASVGICYRCFQEIHPNVILPATGTTYNYISSSGKTIYTTVKITSLTYSYDKNGYLFIYLDGEKTYDYKGTSGTEEVCLKYKIYDDGGFVVTSGYTWVSNLRVGEKFKNQEIRISHSTLEKSPSSYYKIEFYDYGV